MPTSPKRSVRGRTRAATGPRDASRRRGSARQAEELGVLVLALVFSLAGFEVRALWLVSIVLMTLLLGLMAAGLRGADGGGSVISEVVAEAKILREDIASSPESNGT
jgi:hypothetical protein